MFKTTKPIKKILLPFLFEDRFAILFKSVSPLLYFPQSFEFLLNGTENAVLVTWLWLLISSFYDMVFNIYHKQKMASIINTIIWLINYLIVCISFLIN